MSSPGPQEILSSNPARPIPANPKMCLRRSPGTLYILAASLMVMVTVVCATTNSSLSASSNNKSGPSQETERHGGTIKRADTTTPTPTRANSSLADNVDSNKQMKKDLLTAASLLSPSFIRGLLGSSQRRPSKARPAAEEDEMEEVTQTIMVPIKELEMERQQQVSAAAAHHHKKSLLTSGINYQLLSNSQGVHNSPQESTVPSAVTAGEPGEDFAAQQPNAEASLRLTSTEIGGGLLNDREAPELYRERELNGDGVLVGEEPASSAGGGSQSRLNMAASGPFSSQLTDEYRDFQMNAFDGSGGDDDALYRQRLAQAASSSYGGGGGGAFSHRFGSQAFGAAELGPTGGGQFGAGGLMQSPNEYSEMNNYGGGPMGGSGGFADSLRQQQFAGADYNSGLLRAGSKGSYGGDGMGAMMGHVGSGNALEAASAQAYGGGYFGGGGGGGGEFAGGQSSFYGAGGGGAGAGLGRLQAHASFNPYMQAAGESEYMNRFGQHQSMAGFGMDQRGFASQNSHQIMTQQRSHGAASGGHEQMMGASNGRLVPLTPVVQLTDELNGVTQPSVLSSINNRNQITHGPSVMMQQRQQAFDNGVHHQANGQPVSSSSASQKIYDALEDDPKDVSQADDGEQGDGEQNPYPVSSEGGGPMSSTTTMSSVQQEHFVADSGSGAGVSEGQPGGGSPSFVLNVPPPDEQSSSVAAGSHNHRGPPHHNPHQQHMVEFSRVGSAGYLGPTMGGQHQASRSLGRKFGHHHQHLQGAAGSHGGDDSSEEPSESSTSSKGGADNPAHAGKYIIDK